MKLPDKTQQRRESLARLSLLYFDEALYNSTGAIEENLTDNTKPYLKKEYVCGRTAPITDPFGRSSSFVSQEIPSDLQSGQSYIVSVTLQNDGTSVWRTSEGFKLGTQSPADNII